MVKNKYEKIRLDNIIVNYEKTTLKQLLKSGYEVKDGWSTFHEESSTIMCSFFKDEEYMGELVFFDMSETPLTGLMNCPINLVLLDKEPNPKKNSYLDFMDFLGKSGKKDVKFLTIAYLFCWLIILICHKEIPVELIYVTALLPVVFFGFSFLFWGLKSLFSYLYQKMSQIGFVLFSGTLFFLWTWCITFLYFQTKASSIDFFDIPIYILPFLVLLIIDGFFIYQIICFWLFNRLSKSWILKLKKYTPPHLILYGLIGLVYLLFGKILFIEKDSFASVFFLAIFLQLVLYCAFSIIVWMRVLLYALFDIILPFQKKKKS